MDVSPKRDFMIEIPGGTAFVLGLVALFGWVLDMPLLTHINSDWKPMVPGTALCFMFGGLALLLSASKESEIMRARAQGLLIGMVLMLASARGLELLLTSLQQTEFTAPLWLWLYKNQGQMSIQTVFGFLAFVAGYLQLHWGKTQSRQRFARLLSITLIAVGLATVFAYAIKLPYLFESEFFKSGLIWLSLPTAVGLALLGLGLWGVARQHEWSDKRDKDLARARQIYRATVLVIALTTLATGTIGIIFLEEATLAQSKTDMTQTIKTKQAHLADLIEDHIERAQLASTDPTLMASVHGLLQNIRHKVPITVQTQIAERLIQHGFTGVGLESGDQTKTIIGKLLPDALMRFPLRDSPNAFLIWDKDYYLHMRIPVKGDTHGSPEGYLIIEQAMPRVRKLIDDANHWGETGTLPMCGRLNADKLLCYPQREQANLYMVPDKINGMPIPMTYALSGKHAVAILTDYRG